MCVSSSSGDAGFKTQLPSPSICLGRSQPLPNRGAIVLACDPFNPGVDGCSVTTRAGASASATTGAGAGDGGVEMAEGCAVVGDRTATRHGGCRQDGGRLVRDRGEAVEADACWRRAKEFLRSIRSSGRDAGGDEEEDWRMCHADAVVL